MKNTLIVLAAMILIIGGFFLDLLFHYGTLDHKTVYDADKACILSGGIPQNEIGWNDEYIKVTCAWEVESSRIL